MGYLRFKGIEGLFPFFFPVPLSQSSRASSSKKHWVQKKVPKIVKTQNWDGKVKSFRCKARKS